MEQNLKALDPEVKEELLMLAEKLSKESLDATFRIAELLIKKSTNKFDDLLLPALPFIKEKVSTLIEEIHKED